MVWNFIGKNLTNALDNEQSNKKINVYSQIICEKEKEFIYQIYCFCK